MHPARLKAALAVVLVLACGMVARAEDAPVGERHIEVAGGYSFAPPKDWTLKEFPGMKYQFAFGPAANGFAPNINCVDEAFNGTVDTYANENLKSLQAIFQGFKKISQVTFKTEAGVSGVKLVTTSEQQKMALRQTFFFLDGPAGKKLVFTCSCLAEGGEKLDPVFEASIKTVKLEKK
jgi:hypothetical protein